MDYAKPQWWLVHEQGERDGISCSPDSALLRSEHREDYIAGYAEGFTERRSHGDNNRFGNLWGHMVQGRYPNAPPYAVIA